MSIDTMALTVYCPEILQRMKQHLYQFDRLSSNGKGNGMRHSAVCFVSVICLIPRLLFGLAQTSGTPLGGMGTGYVVYNAVTGDFATSAKIPPFGYNNAYVNEFEGSPNNISSSSGFHLFVNGQTAVMKAKTANEDAKLPIYTAAFAPVGPVTFTLTGFGPFIPGNANARTAQLPLAMFEVVATNSGAAVDAAVAMEFADINGNRGLLTANSTGNGAPALGNKAISYGSQTGTDNAFLIAGCDQATATYSAGANGSFNTTGALSNSAGNAVAVKAAIPANGSVKFRFVLSWYRLNEASGSNGQKEYRENYYYHNFYRNSQAIAQYGMDNFTTIHAGATSIVNRVLASNLPDWYEDRLLNNLYPMLHNSISTKDGRVAFWEGKYAIIGTLDQQEHAQPFYTFTWPEIQWRQFKYWARTQFQGEKLGQIHHDHNQGPYVWTVDAHYLFKWDEWNHIDYQYCPDISNWSDLNIMFIFGCYELFMATGDRDSMTAMWPYLKNTGNRLIAQCAKSPTYKHLPTTCKSTYDEEATTGVYNSSIAITAFSCMAEMAKLMNDAAEVTRYQQQYEAARQEFTPYAFTATFGKRDKITEGDVGGYSFARYLGLPAIMDSNVIATGLDRLDQYYSGQSTLRAKLGYYHFYTYDHWGGAAIACNRADEAMKVHKWNYDFYYTASPKFVHWQDIHYTNTSYYSYMTAPCAWRSLFQMWGYLMDNASQRLFVRPCLPAQSVGKKLTNIPLLDPKGWGTLTYDETVTGSKYQDITIPFDNPVTVKELVLKNNTAAAEPGVSVVNNGTYVQCTATAEGSGFEKNIRIVLASPIQVSQGLKIEVHNAQVGAKTVKCRNARAGNAILSSRLSAGQPIAIATAASGRVRIDLTALDGTRIASVCDRVLGAGRHAIAWDGTTTAEGMYLARMVTSTGSVSKPVYAGR